MGLKVATKAAVRAEPSAVLLPPATSGTWTRQGEISVTSYAKLKIDGQAVVSEAKCTFAFSGTAPNGAAVTGSDVVSLSAAVLGKTKLQGGAQQVLRDGDRFKSPLGNALVVGILPPWKLRSA